MNAILAFITKAFDLILYPFSTLAPVFGVAFMSFLTALFVLWVYSRVSNQTAIKRLRKRIQAYFLGIYLFRNDLSLIIESMLRIFSNTFLYIGHSLRPLAVVIIPIALVCVQMQLRYGHSNLKPGDRVMTAAGLTPQRWDLAGGVTLHASDGLSLDSPPLTISSLREIDWDVMINRPGKQSLTFAVNGTVVRKDLYVGNRIHRTYPATRKASFWNALVYPGGETIDTHSPFQYVMIHYPSARIGFLGLHLHWSIVYFLLAIIFGLLLKRFFGVEF